MPIRYCVTGCGNTLGLMVRSNTRCRKCRDKEVQTLRTAKREQRAAVAKINGAILLHSCLSNGVLDPAPPGGCLCRKFISVSQARQLVDAGRAVDWTTRKEFFNNGPIVEKSRRLAPPISSLGQRVAIERRTEHRDLDEREITRLKASIEEDKFWRAREEDCKIDIEHQIAVEAQAKLIRSYTDAEWLAIEREFALHRGFCDGIGHDERTLGSVGLNVRSQRATQTDDDEIQDRDEETVTNETEAENEPTPIDGTETEGEVNDAADERREFDEELEEAA